MPTFSNCCGRDEYVCQKCTRILCSKCHPPEWRPDITGHQSAGNVCPECLKKATVPVQTNLFVNKDTVTKTGELDFIRKKLATDTKWATRGLLVIYNRQTEDEQRVDETKHHNNIGFTGYDAPLLSSFAKQYMQRKWLSFKQVTILKKRISKYCQQIYELSDKTKLLGCMENSK